MTPEQDKMLAKQLQPIVDELGSLFTRAMQMRLSYHLIVAEEAGAEAEDIPKIMEQALASGATIMRKAMADLAEVENATRWAKAHKGAKK